jgi:CRISPR/Cas system CSM-associated protein Csm3 (group 7 of RAMP superfamily)
MGQFQRGGRGGRQFQQPAPKPFAFMPLPNRVNRQRPTGHDLYNAECTTGQIQGTIEALSPIHIGSGIIDLGQDVELIKTAVRTSGNVVIPGSSLKGAIRSVVEAISESCVCKVSGRIRRAVPRDFAECRQKERLCVACRMFGAMGFQGNVAVQDAPQIEGEIVTKLVPELYAPGRYQHGMRDIPGRKFYMHGQVASGETPVEACEVGSKFRFVVQIDNLRQAEWGLLFTALGHHPNHPFKIKIGGAKPVCFGSIDFQLERIQIEAQTRDQYLDWDVKPESAKTGEPLETWKRECITQATDSLIKQNLLTDLAHILRYPNDRNCPSGLY